MLVASAAAAEPLDAKSEKPVTFRATEAGAVDSSFHPRKDRNRVFYAASLPRGPGWVSFTSIPANPGVYNFRKYSVLAVFYKDLTAGFWPRVQSVRESPAGDLSVTVTLDCYNTAFCAAPPYDPAPPWGYYVVVQIDKRSLVRPPKTLHVTTAFTP